jgi:hypothetical protein
MNKAVEIVSLIQDTVFLRYIDIEVDPSFEDAIDNKDDLNSFLDNAIEEYQFIDDYKAIEFITEYDCSLETTFRYMAECNERGENMSRIRDLDTGLLAWYLLKCMSIRELESIKESIKEIYND